jgi:hypothetical protein
VLVRLEQRTYCKRYTCTTVDRRSYPSKVHAKHMRGTVPKPHTHNNEQKCRKGVDSTMYGGLNPGPCACKAHVTRCLAFRPKSADSSFYGEMNEVIIEVIIEVHTVHEKPHLNPFPVLEIGCRFAPNNIPYKMLCFRF